MNKSYRVWTKIFIFVTAFAAFGMVSNDFVFAKSSFSSSRSSFSSGRPSSSFSSSRSPSSTIGKSPSAANSKPPSSFSSLFRSNKPKTTSTYTNSSTPKVATAVAAGAVGGSAVAAASNGSTSPSYSNSSGIAATNNQPAQTTNKVAFSTAANAANTKSQAATAFESYKAKPAPSVPKNEWVSSRGTAYKPTYTGRDYDRNYETINRRYQPPAYVDSGGSYTNMWVALMAIQAMNNAAERERYMMMLRSDPKYPEFYQHAVTNPNIDDAARANLIATNDLKYADKKSSENVDDALGTILLSFLVLICAVGIGFAVICAIVVRRRHRAM